MEAVLHGRGKDGGLGNAMLMLWNLVAILRSRPADVFRVSGSFERQMTKIGNESWSRTKLDEKAFLVSTCCLCI